MLFCVHIFFARSITADIFVPQAENEQVHPQLRTRKRNSKTRKENARKRIYKYTHDYPETEWIQYARAQYGLW